MDFEDFACTGDCNEYFSFAANSPTCNVLIDAIVACYERIDCTAFATNDVQTATDMACADEIACAEPCFGDGPFP